MKKMKMEPKRNQIEKIPRIKGGGERKKKLPLSLSLELRIQKSPGERISNIGTGRCSDAFYRNRTAEINPIRVTFNTEMDTTWQHGVRTLIHSGLRAGKLIE